jgi:hypothetical protein
MYINQKHQSGKTIYQVVLLLFFFALACPRLACADLPAGEGSAPTPVRFTVTDATPGARPPTPAYLTLIGRDGSGRWCRVTPEGRLLPCAAADNKVIRGGRSWCDYAIPIHPSFHLDLDRTLTLDSARAYLSLEEPVYLRVDEATGNLVEPDPANPADPNRGLRFDWLEFAMDASGFHGNTTCVDRFGLPVTLALTDRANPDRVLGPVGIREAGASLFQAWEAEVPPDFQGLAEPGARQILAPGHSPAFATGALRTYFTAYFKDLWQRYRTEPLILTPGEGTFRGHVDAAERLVFTRDGDPAEYVIQGMPSTREALLCDGVLARGNGLEKVLGAQLGALMNRHLLEAPLRWRDPAAYYRHSPCNHYASFWHRHSLDGKAYGFAYDDVGDQSPSLATPNPLEIQVAFRTD